MADILNIAGRVSSISEDGIVTTAEEIKDEDQGRRQSEVNARVQELDENLNRESSGVNARLEALEALADISVGGGEVEIENDPDGIVSGSGKVPTANAVAGRIVPLEHVITNEEMDEVLGGELPVYLTDRDGNAVLGEDNKPIEII